MKSRSRALILCVCAASSATPLRAQSETDRVTLVVATGRPLRVRIDDRITIKRVGQAVKASVIDPVYAYDRIVIPAGATVTGEIVRFKSTSRWSRVQAWLRGDLTPPRTPVVRFDALVLPDGSARPIATVMAPGRDRISLSTTTAATHEDGLLARGKEEAAGRVRDAITTAKQRVRSAIGAVRAPGKMQRLQDAAISQLPYHPQYVNVGTIYEAELTAPLSFGDAVVSALTGDAVPDASSDDTAPDDSVGRAVPTAERPPCDNRPAPASVLTARLVTPLDSSTTARGTRMQAVLTEPVFSPAHHLIYPEGTTLDGEVTFAKRAARLHRNGQLRFLIEQVTPPRQRTEPLLASLYAVEASQDDRLVVDEEGGAAATNSKTRFIVPALAVLSLRASIGEGHRRFDHDADDNEPVSGQGNYAGRGVAGFLGLGFLGAGIGQISRPAAIGLGVYGAVRTLYSNVLGKGHDVVFPQNTVIQVQLSPAGAAAKP